MKAFLSLFLLSVLTTLASDLPASFAYVLQAEKMGETQAAAAAKITASERDWIVLDASYDEDALWSRESVESIRQAKPGRKVIAYISIGEAEDYRPYWKKEWAKKRPDWLEKENPDWKGNFRVAYWNADWQNLILTAVDEALESGFDGVYLDIVDGFETYEQEGDDYIADRKNPSTGQSYRRDMVDWVKTVSERVRKKNPQALVVPQNGSQLLGQTDFVAAISAIGVEYLFTEGNKPQPASHTSEVLSNLRAIGNKPVLVIEYPKNPDRAKAAEKLAHEHGFVWLVTDRELKTLGVSGD